ncbi:MAG: hypothetical protein ABDI20_02175 [Candidatus Bipolaricaulaceae bacterium]
MRKTWFLLVLVGTLSSGVLGCNFVFSYDRIVAPLGTWGEVGIRVYKTHTKCTLPSPDAYKITVERAQILSQTPWREIQPSVLEKWLVLSLAQEGEGYLKIAKTCTREGYEEAVLPLRVTAPAAGGPWETAWTGTYPFAPPAEGEVLFVQGPAVLEEEKLTVAGNLFFLPEALPSLAFSEARLFYLVLPSGEARPLLLVAAGVFWRFDHLWPTLNN